MGASSLGSRAIIGRFYDRLSQNIGTEWVNFVSPATPYESDQAQEEYRWLGNVPQMREWVGPRTPKTLIDNGFIIRNKDYEASIQVTVAEIRRDKTGQVMERVDDLADRANSHWAKLLTTLIQNGESQVAYDGQYFYDTDHLEGDSGSQSNKITNDIATPTAPTEAEMIGSIMKGVTQILTLKDNEGEPLNEGVTTFLVMVPVSYLSAATAALKNTVVLDGSTLRSNVISNLGGVNFTLAVNPRLTWTDRFAIFSNSGSTRALIRQEEVPISIDAVAEGSEEEFKNKRHWYGVYATRSAGFGMWQKSVMIVHT